MTLPPDAGRLFSDELMNEGERSSDPPKLGSAERFDGLCIAALATAVLLIPAVPIGLGIVGLRRIARERRRGRGLAVAAIVIGAVVLASQILVGIVLATGAGDRGAAIGRRSIPAYESGTCLEKTVEDLNRANVVACSEPHEMEVIARIDLRDLATSATVQDVAQSECQHLLARELLDARPTVPVVGRFYAPSSTSWGEGNTFVACVVAAREGSGNLVGSLVTPISESLTNQTIDVPFPEGTCFPTLGFSTDAETVPCDQPHAWQLVGYRVLDSTTVDDAEEEANDLCYRATEALGLDSETVAGIADIHYYPQFTEETQPGEPLVCGIQANNGKTLVGDAFTGKLSWR